MTDAELHAELECVTLEISILEAQRTMPHEFYTHYFAWRNNAKRQEIYRRRCTIVARGSMNSVLIRFENGDLECVSRNAVRRLSWTK